jgi:hypothetical protein
MQNGSQQNHQYLKFQQELFHILLSHYTQTEATNENLKLQLI